MWPYRPESLTQLIPADELEALLACRFPPELQASLALIEPAGADSYRRIDPDAAVVARERPFCSLLRHGRISGTLAFDGGNEECEKCEARLAARVLRAGDREVVHSRCHMGLSDYATTVVVKDRALAAIVAGGTIESAEQRARIAKKVGKLGKLTRGEVRSLAESLAPVTPVIRPATESARERLLAEIERIPPTPPRFDAQLLEVRGMMVDVACRRFQNAVREWEEDLVARVLPHERPPPLRTGEIRRWLHATARKLESELALGFVAIFGRPLGEEAREEPRPLQLLAESGLSVQGATDSGGQAALELDAGRLFPGGTGLEPSRQAVSALISALHPSAGAPPEWKDRLTKSTLVTALLDYPGEEVVLVFGPPASGLRPETEDYAVLWRLGRRVCERYLLSVLEARRRRLARELERYEAIRRRENDAARSPIRPTRFDLRKLLDQCVRAVSAASEGRGVTFDARGLPERLMVEADRSKLQAAFLFILQYACENARPGEENLPSVLLVARRDHRRRHRVTVLFDMVSRFLTREERRRLFSETRQVSRPPGLDGPPRPEGEGGGEESEALTLRDVQRYLSWHGGRLHVESIRTERDGAHPERWLGRLVFTLTFHGAER